MVVEVLTTKAFEQAMSQHEYPKAICSKIRLLAANPRDPSLHVHKVDQVKERNIWECYVTHNERLLYEKSQHQIVLWYLGTQTIADRANQLNFDSTTALTPLIVDLKASVPQTAAASVSLLEALPTENSSPKHPRYLNQECNHFQFVEDAHLRLLGVPTDVVQRLKQASSTEEAFAQPELPEQTRLRLERLFPSQEFYTSRFDDTLLIFRTTLDRLEGYCGGKIKQLMLNLEPEQQKYVNMDAPHIVLYGTAGSGKTTVGIYRAIRLARQGRRVLLLAFTRTLSVATKLLIQELIGSIPSNLEVMTLHQWMTSLLRSRSLMLDIGEDEQHIALLDKALAEVPVKIKAPVSHLDNTFFQHEIKYVIKGFGINSLEEYKEFRRYGRKGRKGSRQREAIWTIYETYQRQLDQAKIIEWSDVAPMTLRTLREQPLPYPFDDVIVDEAQDLTFVDLQVVQQIIKPLKGPTMTSSIMLLADVAQTIYSRGFSWKQAGIEGMDASRLKRNFRNTYQIAEAAALLLERNTLMRDEYVDPEKIKRQGPSPIVVENTMVYDQVTWVQNRIRDLISDQSFRLSDFAVLCPNHQLCNMYIRSLEKASLRTTLYKQKGFSLLENCIKVLTIHSAKGLEFPVVFMVGLVEGILPFILRGQQDENNEELELEELEKQRRLCYVGMTRATDGLYLLTVKEKKTQSQFIHELTGKVITW